MRSNGRDMTDRNDPCSPRLIVSSISSRYILEALSLVVDPRMTGKSVSISCVDTQSVMMDNNSVWSAVEKDARSVVTSKTLGGDTCNITPKLSSQRDCLRVSGSAMTCQSRISNVKVAPTPSIDPSSRILMTDSGVSRLIRLSKRHSIPAEVKVRSSSSSCASTCCTRR